jgi:hyperosmotically inducible periplasmic protein
MRFVLNLLLSFIFSLTLAHAQAFGQELSDSAITSKITQQFSQTPSLNPLTLSIATVEGVVSLQGYVKNKQAFVEALKLVKGTPGVKAVDADELIIKPKDTSLADAYITAKVEAAILRAKVFDDESIPLVGINASTSNGTVTLSGRLKKIRSIGAILKRVSAIHGVKKIISDLQLGQDEA